MLFTPGSDYTNSKKKLICSAFKTFRDNELQLFFLVFRWRFPCNGFPLISLSMGNFKVESGSSKHLLAVYVIVKQDQLNSEIVFASCHFLTAVLVMYFLKQGFLNLSLKSDIFIIIIFLFFYVHVKIFFLFEKKHYLCHLRIQIFKMII